jgi:agmatinase
MLKPDNYPYNYGGIEPEFSDRGKSRITVIPVPYDVTTTYISGTRNGPDAIIEASTHMELYDEELEKETYRVGIHTHKPLAVSNETPKEMLRMVSETASLELTSGKYPVMIGGEHSISLGMIRELKKKYPRLSVLQLDAHADFRESYQGTPYNHACIGRRISEICPLVQVGVRSISEEGAERLKSSGVVTVSDYEIRSNEKWHHKVLQNLTNDVYLTLDLDVLDPAIMPAVGTPEPGGLNWHETINLLRVLSQKRKIVSFDMVELSPQPGNIAPDFLAAKLLYRIMGYVAEGENWM